jgi:hypothetical protein
VFLGCKEFTAIVLILINFNYMNDANSEVHGWYVCRFVWRSVETCLFPPDVTRAMLDKRRATHRGEDFLVSWSRSTSTSSIFRCVYTHTHTQTHTNTHTHTVFIGASPIANSFPSINWRRNTSVSEQCSVRVLTDIFMLMKLLYLPKCRLSCVFITSFAVEHLQV